jgi:hypothetical protein
MGASTPGYVKLLLPPRQSRGNSHFGLGFHYNTGTRIMTQGSPKFPSSTMPIATVKQLCVPSAIVKSDSLVEQVAQIEDFASGRVDGRAFFQRNYFTQRLDLLVRRGFERLAGESEDAPALVVGAGRRVGVQPRQDSPLSASKTS